MNPLTRYLRVPTAGGAAYQAPLHDGAKSSGPSAAVGQGGHDNVEVGHPVTNFCTSEQEMRLGQAVTRAACPLFGASQ